MRQIFRTNGSRRALALASLTAILVALPAGGSAAALQPRIVGGTTQTISQWPFIARVLVTGSSGVATCSGTLVAPNMVLTAAHCVADPSSGTITSASEIRVVTGTATMSGGQTSAVSQVIPDPDFEALGSSLSDYDAALLVLTTPSTQPSVSLATAADSAVYGAGTTVAAAGWGDTSGSATSYSTTLQAAQMGVLSQSTCQHDSRASFGTKLDIADQICTLSASETTGICYGDSGGPLMATDANGASVEIGLTIWNTGNCVTNQPDYFTNVSALSSWLSPEIAALATSSTTGSGQSGTGSSASATPSTAQPRTGAYKGKTGQGRAVSIAVANSRTQVSTATVTVQLRCTRLKRLLTYAVAPKGGSYWPRRITQSKGLGFKDTLTFRGWHVALGAYFWTNGKAKGSVSVTGSNKTDGSCHTGTVRWTAKIS